ncbi:hypothetical protein GOODEAATRI_015915 [Goodea atripinnis]|uniref:Uncharacterized protein n=1 Tax=Goodea atripinnis TaxID=208336 RepID=A0ABV0MSF3_9TELE
MLQITTSATAGPQMFIVRRVDTRYCYTLHMMNNHGDSVSVTKRCATLENCRFAGCVNITHNDFQVYEEQIQQLSRLHLCR